MVKNSSARYCQQKKRKNKKSKEKASRKGLQKVSKSF